MYVIKQNGADPFPTGSYRSAEYRPDYVYCLLPSYEIDNGDTVMYNEAPKFIKNFSCNFLIEEF